MTFLSTSTGFALRFSLRTARLCQYRGAVITITITVMIMIMIIILLTFTIFFQEIEGSINDY